MNVHARIPKREAPALKFRFSKGRVFKIHDDDHVFHEAVLAPVGTPIEEFGTFNMYHFIRRQDCAFIRFSEDQIDEAYAAEAFRPLSGAEARGRLPALPPEKHDAPDIRMRRFWCEQWDRLLPARSAKAGEAFIARVRSEFAADPDFQSIADRQPAFWTIRRWVDERGCTGSRPSEKMLDGRKGRLGMFGDQVERAMASTCLRFWTEKSVRHRIREYDRLVKVLGYLNERAARRAERQAPGGKLPALVRIPDRATFYRRCEYWESRKTTAARDGDTLARRIFAGARPGLTANHALEVAIIDGTTSDTRVATAEDGLPLGRPTVMLAVDVRTRAIVSMSLSFEGEGLMSALATFDGILRPKTAMIADRPDLKGPINLYGLPGKVVLDNRWANVGKSARSAAREMGVDLEFAPVASGEYKAICERAIGTITEMVFRPAPGGLPGSVALMRRMGLTGVEAVIPVDVLEDRLIDAVAAYNTRVHSSLGCSPWAAWNHALSVRGIDIPARPDFLRDALGELREVSLSRTGITIEGVRYHDPDETTLLLEDLAVFENGHRRRVRAGAARARVKIKRAPWDISRIQVWNPVREAYVRLPAVNQRVLAGVRISQWKLLQDYAKAEGLPFSTDREQIEARLALVRRLQAADPKARAASRRKAALILQDPPARLAAMLRGSNVRIAEAQARHDGLSPAAYDGLTPAAMPKTSGDVAKGYRPRSKRKVAKAMAANSEFTRQAEDALRETSGGKADGPRMTPSKSAPDAPSRTRSAEGTSARVTAPDAATIAAKLMEWTGG
jgi:putative transposase